MGSFTNPLKEVRTLKDTYFDQLNGTVLFAENHNSDMSNTEVVDNFLGKSGEESERAQHWTRGVLSVFAKNTEGAGNFVYGVLNSINQIVFNDRVSAGVTIAIGSLIYLLIAILFTKVLLIGLYRYLLEIRVYTGTRISPNIVSVVYKKGTAYCMGDVCKKCVFTFMVLNDSRRIY